jgi:hypothetical protein
MKIFFSKIVIQSSENTHLPVFLFPHKIHMDWGAAICWLEFMGTLCLVDALYECSVKSMLKSKGNSKRILRHIHLEKEHCRVIKLPKWTITNSESISPEGDNVEHRFWGLHSSHCCSSILIVLLSFPPSQGRCCARKNPSIARSN